MVEEKQKETKSVSGKYELVEVPTETTVVVREAGTDNLLEDKQVLLEILNTLKKIEKAVC